MLTAETKRHIDAARQVLVGVIPNPASQIDQITNALIYKFMDDMDQAALKAGDKASFFVGELEPYAWTRLMDVRKGNQERMNLYAEAIEKFSTAEKLPELFRDIFRKAHLPFRSPEVLGIFLSEINYFDYSHPEELGNAYEYLLSIMGSQGDAGQFRTPRHIIDFVVAAVNPKKDERIHDPACGTAGFLISAYKHILSQHNSKDSDKALKPLTPSERRKLFENFEGYDISPEMVKLSRVNMYLHQFKSPKIFEYDSLSNDARWDEKFDVIVMNPPFMSPKGGITPHKRFGIRSNRSEVLFVDYVMQHLKPRGRAGMVIPEGIIFQSASAHTELRKALVQDGLHAVVSLPSGVFNPYSNVKTSVLFFDNEVSKKTKDILFVKVNNDGHDLGAQRRPIDKNDLPEALRILHAWREHVLNKAPAPESPLATVISREEIANSGDWNLSADRYKQETDYSNAKWPMVELGEVLEYEQPTDYIVESEEYEDHYGTPVLTAGKTFILGYTNEKTGIYSGDFPAIIFDDFTTATKLVDFPFKVKSSAMKILHTDKTRADAKFLYYVMQAIDFPANEHKRYWISEYSKIKIPLPPLEVQRELAKTLDSYQKVIDGATTIVENWNPNLDLGSGENLQRLGDVLTPDFGERITKAKDSGTKYPVYGGGGESFRTDEFNRDGGVVISRFAMSKECVRFVKGKFWLLDSGFTYSVDTSKVLKEYVDWYLYSIQEKIYACGRGHAQKNIDVDQFKDINIPVPSLERQKEIVESIEHEYAVVESSKKLAERNQRNIKDLVTSVWG